MCLGAKGVGLGRPFFYAHTCYGDEGIVRAIESTLRLYTPCIDWLFPADADNLTCLVLSAEVNLGMKLLGATKIEELKPEMLELMPGLVGEPLK